MSLAPVEVDKPETDQEAVPDSPWVTIVWNDPVNLMSYVTYVFQTVFGYAKPKAEKLMLDVHHKGKAVVSSGAREAMERDAETLHGYGLWATVSHDSVTEYAGDEGEAVTGFRAAPGGATARFAAAQATIIRDLVSQVAELVATDMPDSSDGAATGGRPRTWPCSWG